MACCRECPTPPLFHNMQSINALKMRINAQFFLFLSSRRSSGEMSVMVDVCPWPRGTAPLVRAQRFGGGVWDCSWHRWWNELNLLEQRQIARMALYAHRERVHSGKWPGALRENAPQKMALGGWVVTSTTLCPHRSLA